jgi:hypothetical protein
MIHYVHAAGLNEITSAAMLSWALLLTALPGLAGGSDFTKTHLLTLVRFVGSENKEVQHAAQEAASLLLDLYNQGLPEPYGMDHSFPS